MAIASTAHCRTSGKTIANGKLLWYPSDIYRYSLLQWFTPCRIIVFVITIPALIRQVAIGQAHRSELIIPSNNYSNVNRIHIPEANTRAKRQFFAHVVLQLNLTFAMSDAVATLTSTRGCGCRV
ncbi:hypothetical protein BDW42DRAFT_195804 [Aspergillus taichungensis]|uniref:Uncharacterized protein n=1 Tax=Aspergillus taichungensis TaxID=482145 RepID=A0A2J5HMW1_9EURO|nr:hypothetical protein BDW42DRAFT_195804 [Aspergillus taichungensis]